MMLEARSFDKISFRKFTYLILFHPYIFYFFL